MTLRIVWSEFAENQLDEIYNYYEKFASEKIATDLLIGIIQEADLLIHSPLIGQEEELLKERNIQYRYLVYLNYKLIYSVDMKNGFIKIADIFDTRQHPPKIKRTK